MEEVMNFVLLMPPDDLMSLNAIINYNFSEKRPFDLILDDARK